MFSRTRLLLGTVAALISLPAISGLHAATFLVDSLPALEARLATVAPGDRVVLKNGLYTTTTALNLTCAGEAAKPIVIAAETVGGATLAGPHGLVLTPSAAHVVIEGFTFTHAAGEARIEPGARFCRLTRNTFACPGEGAYLTIAGDDTEIDRNEFRDKHTVGNMIDVRGAGSQVARRLWIHHNFFHDFTNAGANGGETIRFGLSGLSLSTGEGLVERNLFLRCTGENELISNKSSGNTYRYNTFLDSPGGELSQRHGNDCLIYANYFRHTAGIRIYGDRHQVFSNYLEGNSIGITIGNGDGEVAAGAKLTSHDRPDGCVISFNTLVDNTVQYQMGGRKEGLGATRTTFADNIVQGGGPAAAISSTAPYTDAVWTGNLLWKTTPGDLPATGYTVADPRLAADPAGVLHLQPGSPAIDAAPGDFPAVTFDLDGQPRTAPRDLGADEMSSAPVVARLLTPADVGPASR